MIENNNGHFAAMVLYDTVLDLIDTFKDDPKGRLELYDILFDKGLRNVEHITEDKLVNMAAKCILQQVEASRRCYYERQRQIGMQGKEYGIKGKEYGIKGKEYGIKGKEYGKLGGRPTNESKRIINLLTDSGLAQKIKDKTITSNDLEIFCKNNNVTKEDLENTIKKYFKKC